MDSEKRNSLMVVGYFALGLFGGWLLGSVKPVPGVKPTTHIKAEYYLELRQDNSAAIENCYGDVYTCPMDSIASVLVKDNL